MTTRYIQTKTGTMIPDADGQWRKHSEVEATVEALQAIIKQMGEQACVLAKDGMAAKVQVEALQRERDEAVREARLQKESVIREREVADSYHQDLVKCEATLDALRDAYDELES